MARSSLGAEHENPKIYGVEDLVLLENIDIDSIVANTELRLD